MGIKKLDDAQLDVLYDLDMKLVTIGLEELGNRVCLDAGFYVEGHDWVEVAGARDIRQPLEGITHGVYSREEAHALINRAEMPEIPLVMANLLSFHSGRDEINGPDAPFCGRWVPGAKTPDASQIETLYELGMAFVMVEKDDGDAKTCLDAGFGVRPGARVSVATGCRASDHATVRAVLTEGEAETSVALAALDGVPLVTAYSA